MGLKDFFQKFSRQKPIKLTVPRVEDLIIFGLHSSPKYSDWNSKKAIEEGLKASAVFYSCTQRRAEAISEVKWVAKRKKSNGEYKEVLNSPLQALIDAPNPDFSFSEMMELASYHLDLAGNSFWRIIRAGNSYGAAEIWPLIPYRVSITPGKKRLVEQYTYDNHGMFQYFNPEDIVQLKMSNPDDFLFGMPPLQAAGRAVDIDRESCDWQKLSLQNRGVPDLAIIMDPSSTADQLERVKALTKENFVGAANARKPLITNKDVKTLGFNAVEMDFTNSRTKVWEEICSVMGVPMPIVGILENATLANIETCRKIFWLDTVIPQLRRIRSQLNYQLAKDFGPEWFIDFSLNDIEALSEGLGIKIDNAIKLKGLGFSLKEINEKLELGFEDIPDAPAPAPAPPVAPPGGNNEEEVSDEQEDENE